jgi:hypothetical protein
MATSENPFKCTFTTNMSLEWSSLASVSSLHILGQSWPAQAGQCGHTLRLWSFNALMIKGSWNCILQNYYYFLKHLWYTRIMKYYPHIYGLKHWGITILSVETVVQPVKLQPDLKMDEPSCLMLVWAKIFTTFWTEHALFWKCMYTFTTNFIKWEVFSADVELTSQFHYVLHCDYAGAISYKSLSTCRTR